MRAYRQTEEGRAAKIDACARSKLRRWGDDTPTARVVISLPKPFAHALDRAAKAEARPRGALILDLIGRQRADAFVREHD